MSCPNCKSKSFYEISHSALGSLVGCNYCNQAWTIADITPITKIAVAS